jgi:hypothetical protein
VTGLTSDEGSSATAAESPCAGPGFAAESNAAFTGALEEAGAGASEANAEAVFDEAVGAASECGTVGVSIELHKIVVTK